MEEELIDILKRTGALITDTHAVGTSGRHMSIYINKDALLLRPNETGRVGELFAEKNKNLAIDVVVAPAMGAIILGHWTAYHLGRANQKEILSVYTEKDLSENQIFKRGYDKLVSGKNVLVIEDTTATGGSVAKVVESVKKAGGIVLQACVMVNRDPVKITAETVGAPFSWLAHIPAETYAPDDCPLCKAGVPINTTVGHGKKFLESKGL